MKKEMTLEQAMDRLDEVVALLDGGGQPLEESLKLFEEGTRLARLCSEKLQAAQLKVEQLTTAQTMEKEKTE